MVVAFFSSSVLFFSEPPPPEGGLDLVTITERVPPNRHLQSPPGRTGSLARSSDNIRKRYLRHSRCEHGGVGFSPVGLSGLVRGSGDRA